MKGRAVNYSSDEMAWLEANRHMVISDYHRAFRSEIGRDDVSAAHLHALRKRKGWKTGRTGCFERGAVPHNKGKRMPSHPNSARTQFKKGNLPHNANYAGHERVSKDGYVEVSVEETNPHTGFERRYVLKHRWLWKQIYGPVPDGMALKCRDGNRQNTTPSNWELVPRAFLPRLNGRFGRDYDKAPSELKPTIIAIVKLEHKARELTKGAAE